MSDFYISEKKKTMELFKGLPLYKAEFPLETDGILRVSLVDCPAVESDFMYFDKTGEVRTYAVTNEEKRIVRGVILRADYPIYRNEHGFEFYMVFGAPEIRAVAEKYLVEGRQNNVNLQHERGSDVLGVNLLQFFIKDTENGVSPKGFEDIADGSLFGEYHITNDAVWAEVKAGTFRGFSVEVVCGLGEVEKKPKSKNMGIKSVLKKLFVQMAAVTTDKGILAWDGEDDIAVDVAVYIEEEGERKPAEDGDYTLDDGAVIVVKDGVVAEIKDSKEEPEKPEEPEKEMEEEPKEEPKEEPEKEEPKEKTPDYSKDIEDLKAEIEALKKEIEELKAGAEKTAEELKKFAKAPAGSPANKGQLPQGLSIAARIAAAGRK